MRKKDNRFIITIVLLLIIAIGIGYAALTINLSINGSTTVAGNTWDIHFANVVESTGSVTATTPAAIDTNDNTQINYGITLSRPGDFYEFTVDMVNAGTLPGVINLVQLNGITSAVENIIDYSIVYTNKKIPVLVDDIINAESSKNITVKVSYKDDIDEEDLLGSNVNLNITISITFNQSDKDEITTDNIIQQLKTENSSCFTKYNGQVTDQPGQTVTASKVYFDKCEDKRNIIFNNMCWQMIRTTETGGIKIVYNGEPEDGKCESTRSDHKGVGETSYGALTLNSSYLYGSSFTYDLTNDTFTLIDTTTATWSDSTYENLVGMFTCRSSSNTCTTIYGINGYSSNTQAYAAAYTIKDINYALMGKSSYNANYSSAAKVGYMFNKVYYNNTISPGTTEYKYGSSFTYDENTNTYTLSGTTQNISSWSSGYNTINNTHYTCWNTSGSCNTISYIYYTSQTNAVYFDITGGKSVNDILTEMLSSNDVNRYNSSVKGIIDAWYKQKMINKTNMLEDTVYCNARNITNYGGFTPNGGSTTSNYFIQFKNYTNNNNLVCLNETDQFAVGNNKAKLTYPVALISNEEWYNIGTTDLRKIGVIYLGLSPYYFNYYSANTRVISATGTLYNYAVHNIYGARPAISLSSGTIITGGTGSETDPWIVKE